ncbi:hypothetical protein [Xanthocytophaga flava]|uniref:hypothetical protein n=1 Tax=Xanthocytophaga flava TaxID=3048013 RepID=UPI0028D10DD3|nr:hypothetical protein [Xanthocytophaga flavus]MDJ1466459.1 hypothetical protein [Xanthocytophaga flavus]
MLACQSASTDKNKDSRAGTLTTNEKASVFTLDHSYQFNDFKVDLYKGKLADPDFRNNPFASDTAYVQFISESCKKNAINFSGHYTIIHRSCGAECEHIFIVDRKTGRIFTDIHPNDGRYGYAYQPDSKLLIANSNLFIDNTFHKYLDYWCKPEFYQWEKTDFVLLK